MDNRYYNQNPQVTALLEKIEEQDRVIRHWQGKCAELQQKVDITNEICDECIRLAAAFNKMSWYKKMVYRFKL